ncbi:hypothetical protein PHAMO_30060 [Magnetospirillum molischianum DSM 120]|uniref:Uncharacterized protein n=1 Tax=Magnetospirillum molischianum DSM 120 TaxID=1150626 RepID=H8FU66_MAGML|nr:hypothetical protein PHAMO_30060 [Magnetospirillum molischianum DSM 120]
MLSMKLMSHFLPPSKINGLRMTVMMSLSVSVNDGFEQRGQDEANEWGSGLCPTRVRATAR